MLLNEACVSSSITIADWPGASNEPTPPITPAALVLPLSSSTFQPLMSTAELPVFVKLDPVIRVGAVAAARIDLGDDDRGVSGGSEAGQTEKGGYGQMERAGHGSLQRGCVRITVRLTDL